MKPVSEQQIETVTLNKIKVAMQKLVDERLLMDTHFDIAHSSLEREWNFPTPSSLRRARWMGSINGPTC